jgi:cell wall-associated NlpC family hydrolase
MTPEEIVSRTLSAIGHGCRYSLGGGALIQPGKTEPLLPMDRSGACDCSGFACWVLRIPRHEHLGPTDRWWGTDNIVADARATSPVRFNLLSTRQPGALIIYPGHKEERKWSYGHVGVLVGPERVVHCSAGNYKKTGDAIQETGLEVFLANPRTIVVGCKAADTGTMRT